MSRSIRKFIKNIFRAQLTDEEHLTMRGALQIFMREHPLQSPVHDTEKTSGFSGFLLLVRRPLFVMVALVLMVLVGTSTVTYAAESALPGDLLYPIKVNVNESLRAAVAISPKAKAEWNITRVERRLQEAETLIDEGKLDTDNSLALTERFGDHSDELRTAIENFQSNDDIAAASQIAADFQATLNAHNKIIARLHHDSDDESILNLTDSLEAQSETGDDVESTIVAHVAAQSDENAELSVSNKRQVAKDKLQEVQAHFKRAQPGLDAITSAQVGAELEQASSLVLQGDSSSGTPSLSDSFTSFQKAHRAAQEAQLLIKSGTQLKKRVRTTDKIKRVENANSSIRIDAKTEQKSTSTDQEKRNTNEIKLKIDTRNDSKIDL